MKRPYVKGNVWFVGDLHLGHANIIRYCDRPFATIEEHDAALLGQWRRVVCPEDVMFHVGDLCLGKPEQLARHVKSLTGNIIYLVQGNHDGRSLRRASARGMLPENVRVLDEREPFEMTLGGHRIVLTHHPLDELPTGVTLNVHGHSHGNRSPSPTHLDVSWDVFKRPIRWQEIRNHIEEQHA